MAVKFHAEILDGFGAIVLEFLGLNTDATTDAETAIFDSRPALAAAIAMK